MPSPSLWIRLDLKPQGQIGPGKIALLHAIQDTRSITAAAKALNMSYRRAWLLVDQMNKTFEPPVVVTSIGGSGHGGAEVTEFGERVIAAYRSILVKAEAAARVELQTLAGHLKP
jgi:molybdate transport system regulatory protein